MPPSVRCWRAAESMEVSEPATSQACPKVFIIHCIISIDTNWVVLHMGIFLRDRHRCGDVRTLLASNVNAAGVGVLSLFNLPSLGMTCSVEGR